MPDDLDRQRPARPFGERAADGEVVNEKEKEDHDGGADESRDDAGVAPVLLVRHRDDRLEILAGDAAARERGPECRDDDRDPDDARDDEHRPEEMVQAPVGRARGIEYALRAGAANCEEQEPRTASHAESSGGVLDIFGTAFGVDASGVLRIM